MQLKPGGRIPDKGKKITVCVKNVKDLSRDVIKVCYYPFKIPSSLVSDLVLLLLLLLK